MTTPKTIQGDTCSNRNAPLRISRIEFAAYQFGVRFAQSQALASPDGFFNPRQNQLLMSLNRLRHAAADLTGELALNTDRHEIFQFLSECQANAQRLSGRCYDEDKSADEPIYEVCSRFLDLIREDCASLLQRAVGVPDVARLWYELGHCIARGESPIVGPPYRLVKSRTGRGPKPGSGFKPLGPLPQPRSQKQRGWIFFDKKLVDKLTRQLSAPITKLMPTATSRETATDMFSDLPSQLADGWLPIERGLQELAKKLNPPDPPPSDASHRGEAVIRPANDERDVWIYKKCWDGARYSQIIEELKSIAPSKGWSIVRTIAGIKSAASRWAKRHGKKPIPTRQKGRPQQQ